MISIVNYLTETETKNDDTKLSKGEKAAAGVVGIGGLLAAQLSHAKAKPFQRFKDFHANPGVFDFFRMGKKNWDAVALEPGSDAHKVEAILRTAKRTQDLGVGIAALASGALGARKLYKIYKNNKTHTST